MNRGRVLLALLVVLGCGRQGDTLPAPAPAPEVRTYAQPVNLYFPGESGLLVAERREVRTTGDPEDLVAGVVRLLLGGPENDDLAAVFPEGTLLSAVYLSPSGVAYIDLKGRDGAGPPSGGSTEEHQRLTSLVNSVALNVSEARQVVVLWNGVQPESFGGHFDSALPLAPDLTMVARQP